MNELALADGARLAWTEAGSGEPLLLIMGTGADHGFWGPQVEGLSDRWRVITYDSRGTGASGDFARPEDCTPATLAADAAALLDHLGCGPAHVHGLSLGSCVAQELALARPELVRSLGLHGTWDRSDEWFLHMVESMELALNNGGLSTFIRSATMWILSPDFHEHQTELLHAVEKGYVENPMPTRVEGVLAHCHADRVHDATERLGSIAVPTLVTAGERDIQVPPRYGERVAAEIPGSTYHLFTGPTASHCACFEMAPEWNRVIGDFLAKVSA
ncbi:MAG: alpha/beta fold hydrolase [Acidobacteriota bacterium]